jgi:hypothetical protein
LPLRIEERESVVTVRIGPMQQSTKLACWKASIGKFILQARLGTSSTFEIDRFLWINQETAPEISSS